MTNNQILVICYTVRQTCVTPHIVNCNGLLLAILELFNQRQDIYFKREREGEEGGREREAGRQTDRI